MLPEQNVQFQRKVNFPFFGLEDIVLILFVSDNIVLRVFMVLMFFMLPF